MHCSRLSSTLLAVAGFAGLARTAPTDPSASTSSCKCFPGDKCWPSAKDWAAFNKTVDGRLIATVPLGSPCHGASYNATECQFLQDNWLSSPIQENLRFSFASSSSVMAPLFANASCDPFQPPDSPCTLGNYVQYAVNVSTAAHVSATLQFAAQRNIRFVIRNTGHDYNGRSTGAGALAVWTHHLKDTEVLDWNDQFYAGKALKVGAGIQGFEALAAAHAAGLIVVTGECPSVGIAGGYVQGGGHSALSTNYGLAADNALSYDVVTPNGTLVTATRTQNDDLYWALSGGGAGNYGVVVSVVFRAHPDAVVSGSQFAIDTTALGSETLYGIIDAFHAALPVLVDSGVMIIYFFGDGFFQVPAMTAYGKTQGEIEAILKPFIDALALLGVDLQPTYTQFPSYFDHYQNYWGPFPAGNIQVGTSLFGGRLIPRSALPTFSPTARQLVELGVTFIGVGLNVSHFGGSQANAVLPQWRSSIVEVSLTLPYSFQAPFQDMIATQDTITTVVQPVIEAATPGGGAYMNEADFQQPDFQETFYGANYAQLLKIKQKYDPTGLLYARTAVGSEAWTVAENGRMCRT
ncbi:hypothetical protein Trco_005275 [Trichoderma cornu-damae]|uniref:FAD-binding PCMH-type domain-containing protein n=1 Tax=Trichoderma cornu-damae TaxID=654480 RepID=A0A9P8QP74_9HYPO|nr:hypothetical protein Trco_005275 [Trichoderma cornu-damae]